MSKGRYTGKSGSADKSLPRLAAEPVQKTELTEAGPDGGYSKKPTTPSVDEIVCAMVKSAAKKIVMDDVDILAGFLKDATNHEERISYVKAISELKLNAVGHVLAKMRSDGLFNGNGNQDEPPR